MQETANVYTRSAVYCAASWRRVYFHIWFNHGDLADIYEAIKHQRAFVRGMTRRGVILFTVVYEGAAAPVDSAMRKAINAGQREFDPYIEAGALVMRGRGFGAASVRGIITGLTLLGQFNYPSKVFDTEEKAFIWLAKYLETEDGRPFHPEQLGIVYRQILEAPRAH